MASTILVFVCNFDPQSVRPNPQLCRDLQPQRQEDGDLAADDDAVDVHRRREL
jgi:hypothetical protein